VDNCPGTANPDQANLDGDAPGDACDPDDDNDAVADVGDNCPRLANPGQQNNDGDPEGDACDADDDNDAVADSGDNCPFVANGGQEDSDGDTQGDACDADDDNDGVLDPGDCAPLDPSAAAPPQETAGVQVLKGPATELQWTAGGPGVRYDVAGGTVLALQAGGGTGDATCLADDQSAAAWTDPRPDPAAGDGWYYLVREQNACGSGGYGLASAGSPRLPGSDCP